MSNIDMEKWRATGLLNGLAPEKADMIARTLQTKMEDVLAGNVTYQEFEEEIVRLRSEGAFDRENT